MDPMDLGWLVGVGVGVAGVVAGVFALKFLARARVAWWTSLVGPFLTFGPAAGLILGSILQRGDPAAGALGHPENVALARVGWSLVFFFGGAAAFGLLRHFLASRLVRDQLGIRVPEVFLDMGRLIVWIGMLFAVVGVIWGRTDLFQALFTASAVGTLVLGLALQDTIKNFIAAWSVVGEGTYRVGDWVWIGEHEGEVLSVTRRATKIRTRSGDVVTVPNAGVLTAHVRNMSRPLGAHAEVLHVRAAYDAPPNRVRDVLRRAVQEVPRILAEPRPLFRVRRYGSSGIEYEVKFWLTDLPALHDVRSDLMVQIWYHFRREGIEFPLPIVDLRPRPPREEAPADRRAQEILGRMRSVEFFRALPDDLLALLARDAGFVAFGAGERVVQRGEPGETCYVVDQGSLAVLLADAGIERQVAVLLPGDLFGEMSLLTGEPRSATVRALEDSRLVAVGSSALKTALERSPELAHRLAEAVALRREGLLGAKAALDATARARVGDQTRRLGELIVRFFRLPATPDGDPARAGRVPPDGGVAGGNPGP